MFAFNQFLNKDPGKRLGTNGNTDANQRHPFLQGEPDITVDHNLIILS